MKKGARNPAVDTETVLDNVVELDRLLDETSRREVDSLPVLELSKHMKVRGGRDAPADVSRRDGQESSTPAETSQSRPER